MAKTPEPVEPVAPQYIARAGGYGLTEDQGWVLIPTDTQE
jgi:hypothetical protein